MGVFTTPTSKFQSFAFLINKNHALSIQSTRHCIIFFSVQNQQFDMFLLFCTLFLRMTLMGWTVFYKLSGEFSSMTHKYFAKVLQMNTLCSTENIFYIRLALYERHDRSGKVSQFQHRLDTCQLTLSSQACISLSFGDTITNIFCILDNPLHFVGTHNKINITSRNIIYRHKTQKEPGQLSLYTKQTTG